MTGGAVVKRLAYELEVSSSNHGKVLGAPMNLVDLCADNLTMSHRNR